MSKTVDYPMTSDQRNLLTNLWNSDEATQGRPQLPAEQVERARDYLSLLLVESQAEVAHIGLLQEFYGAKFHYPLSRRFWQGGPRPPLEVGAGFRHHRLLPAETARAVAERGPEVLSPDELAVLLLNPYALWDLADLIDFLLPDYWLGRMEQVGRELMDRHGVEVPIPEIDKPSLGKRRARMKTSFSGALLTFLEHLSDLVTELGGELVKYPKDPRRYKATHQQKTILWLRLIGERPRTNPPNSIQFFARWHDEFGEIPARKKDGKEDRGYWHGSESADLVAQAECPDDVERAEKFVRLAFRLYG